MTWTYDVTDLNTDDAAGRRNVIRFLMGDNDTTDQQVQDEEIAFALTQTGNNVYNAASYVCRTVASKYGRRVDTELDGALKANYSNLSKSYNKLADSIEIQGKKSGATLGLKVGGISKADINAYRDDDDIPSGSFYRDRFRTEDYQGDYRED